MNNDKRPISIIVLPIAKWLNFILASILCMAAVLAFYFSKQQYNWVGIIGVFAGFYWFYFSAFKVCNVYTANGKIFIESLVGNIVDKEISSILCVKYSLFAYKITFTDDSAFYFDLKPKTYLTQIINSETLTGAFIRDAEDNTLK